MILPKLCFSLFLLFSLSLYSQSLLAQGPYLDWVVHFESTANEFASSNFIDNENHLYVTGGFTGTVDFNPGIGVSSITSFNAPENEFYDLYLTKMDLDTSFIWVKRFGGVGASFSSARSVETDSDGNIFILGSYTGIVDFDPGDEEFLASSLGYTSVFICKLNSDGNFLWLKVIGNQGVNIGEFDMSIDSNGNPYLVGSAGNPYLVPGSIPGSILDLNPDAEIQGITTGSAYKMFVIKMNTNGEFIWAKSTETGWARCADIISDSQGDIIVSGGFYGTVDFGMGEVTNNLTSSSEVGFMLRIGIDGTILWVIPVLSTSRGWDIDIDGNHDIIFAGYLYLGKYSPSGDLIWGLNGEGPIDIAHDEQNNIYYTSLFFSSPYYSGLIVKVSTDGIVQWGAVIDKSTLVGRISIDSLGNIYGTGRYNNSITGNTDFDPSSSYYTLPSVQHDAFVLKWSQPAACIATEAELTYITCIDNFSYQGVEYSESGVYEQILENSGGCDSIVTLNLQLAVNIDITITQNGNELSSDQQGESYQWLDCTNSFLPINGANEQSYIATSPGSYAVRVIYGEGLCESTSVCFDLNLLSLNQTNEGHLGYLLPNPASNTVTVRKEGETNNLTIYDLAGKLMHSASFTDLYSIDLSSFPSGLYFVQISDKHSENLKTLKLIVH